MATQNMTPSDRLHSKFLEISKNSNLTDYGIGHFWSAETDENPRTLTQRVQTWRKKQPKTLRDFVSLMDVLGYDVILKKR
jgi:hypothetical protein